MTTAVATVHVEGLKGTVRRLKAFDVELPKVVKAVTKSAAELVAVEARVLVPTGTSDEGDKHPGLLGSTIKAFGSATRATVRAGSAKANYVGPIHFGWGAHNIAANNFLYRALEHKHAAVATQIEREVHALVERVEG